MPKQDTPVTEKLVIGIVKKLGGEVHLDDVHKALLRKRSLRDRINSKYPTHQKLRNRLVWILTQSGYFERVGEPGSATYKMIQGPHPWKGG